MAKVPRRKIMDIQDILQKLEVNDGRFPRTALKQAIEQRELIIPELLRILEYARRDIEHLNDKEYMAHLYAMYLLAQFREPRAYPMMVQFFSTPGEISLDVTGDLVTENLGRILASVSCGEIEPITALIENEQANEYVRDAALDSLVTLVACGERTRDDTITYYRSLFRGKLVREYSHLWNGLVAASAALYPEEVYEDIKLAYRDELLDPFFITLERVEEILSRDKESVLLALPTNHRFTLIDDTIREMEWWACFRSKDSTVAIGQPSPKPEQKPKDKHKRKLAKASRRKNRR